MEIWEHDNLKKEGQYIFVYKNNEVKTYDRHWQNRKQGSYGIIWKKGCSTISDGTNGLGGDGKTWLPTVKTSVCVKTFTPVVAVLHSLWQLFW